MCGKCEKKDVKLGALAQLAPITAGDIKILETKEGTNLTVLGDIIGILRQPDAPLPEPYELNVGVKLFGDCYAKIVSGESSKILSARLFDGSGITRGYINYYSGTDTYGIGIYASRLEKCYYVTVPNTSRTLLNLYLFMTDETAMIEMATDVQGLDKPKRPVEIQIHTLQEIISRVHDSRMASCDPLTVEYGTLVSKWHVVANNVVYDLTSYICGVESARYEKIFITKNDKELGSVWFEPSGALCIQTPFYTGRFHLVHATTWQPDYDAIAQHISHFILDPK